MLLTQSLLKLLFLHLLHSLNLALVDLVVVHVADTSLVIRVIREGPASIAIILQAISNTLFAIHQLLLVILFRVPVEIVIFVIVKAGVDDDRCHRFFHFLFLVLFFFLHIDVDIALGVIVTVAWILSEVF